MPLVERGARLEPLPRLEYITRCRIKRAMRPLTGAELSIAEIALEVGSRDQSHLTSLFRKRVGGELVV